MANEAVSSPPRRGSGRGQSHRDVHATTTDHHPPQAQSTNRSRSRSRDREPQPLNPVRCFAATRYAEFDGEDEPSIDEMIADAEAEEAEAKKTEEEYDATSCDGYVEDDPSSPDPKRHRADAGSEPQSQALRAFPLTRNPTPQTRQFSAQTI